MQQLRPAEKELRTDESATRRQGEEKPLTCVAEGYCYTACRYSLNKLKFNISLVAIAIPMVRRFCKISLEINVRRNVRRWRRRTGSFIITEIIQL